MSPREALTKFKRCCSTLLARDKRRAKWWFILFTSLVTAMNCTSRSLIHTDGVISQSDLTTYPSPLSSPVPSSFDKVPGAEESSHVVGETWVSPSNPSSGTIYHVAQDGSGDFATVQQAATVVLPGDMVYVRAGIYREDRITIQHSGTESAPIVFRNAPGEHPTIQGSFEITNKSHIQISGFEITGQTSQWCAIQVRDGSHHILIERNNIHHFSADHAVCIIESSYNVVERNTISHGYNGIEIGGTQMPCQHNLVESNHIFYNDKAGGNSDGIHLYGAETQFNIVKRNVVHDNSDDGIDTWGSTHNLIVGNIAYHNGYMNTGQIGYDGNGFKLGWEKDDGQGGGNLVINNIAYDNRMMGFTTNGGRLPNILYNNTAYGNLYGFEEWEGSGGSTFKNNLGYMNGTRDYNFASDTVATYNLFAVDPLFEGAERADFHLQASSPAIDIGANLSPDDVPELFLVDVPDFFRHEVLSQIAVDRDEVSRPRGAGQDIGAYEFWAFFRAYEPLVMKNAAR